MGKSIYRAFLLIISIITIGFIFILIGNILIIGDNIGNIVHPYMEYAFYGIILLLSISFIIVPIGKVLRMPTLPELDVKDTDPADKTRKLARRLITTCSYIDDKTEQKAHRDKLNRDITDASSDITKLTQTVRDELDLRFSKARKEIYQAATCSFASTAISQNSTIDTLSTLMINCKLIHKIIQASGFRPNIKQTVRIYINVIFNAFFAHISQAGIEKGATLIINNFIKGLKSVPYGEVIVGSVIDGTVNALMTLRVGFLTLSYLKHGAKGQLSEEDKSAAAIEAIKSLPDILGGKAKNIVDFIAKFFNKKESKENVDDSAENTEGTDRKISIKVPFIGSKS